MDLIQMTRDLGAEIQKSDLYTAYMVAREAADQDKELQDMIGEFNLKKLDLSNAVQSDEKDRDKINALNVTVRDLYNRIMANPLMMAANTTRSELDQTLQFMQQILVYSANGEDPQTIEPESDSCGGDCSGCSGCEH